MSVPHTTKRTVRPTHPGEMLREDFLPDYGLSVAALAAALEVSRQSVNELLRERRALSPEMALRLARLFLPDTEGRRPFEGKNDSGERNLVLFHEYFDGDTGRGLGASHQTGWTALAVRLFDKGGCGSGGR